MTRRKGVLENTESAFAAAIRGNYTIECDLQVTREGEAVVFHDETLERLTEAEGLLKLQHRQRIEGPRLSCRQ